MYKENKNLTARQIESLQRREVLKSLSNKAKLLRELKPQFDGLTVNEILMQTVYNPKGLLTFKTFHEWKREGCTVNKGSKGVIIWGQPTKAKAAQKEESEEEKEFKFFPVCFLFSNEQVTQTTKKKQAPPATTPEPPKMMENKNELIPNLEF